jgi:hypothetical protein
MTEQSSSMTWQVRPRRWSDLVGGQRALYGEIVASYGGSFGERSGRFRRYRAAEACANSVRSELGVEIDVELKPDPHPPD